MQITRARLMFYLTLSVVLTITIISLGAYGGYYFYQATHQPKPTIVKEESTNPAVEPKSAESEEVIVPKEKDQPAEEKNEEKPLVIQEGPDPLASFSWQEPKQIESLNFFGEKDEFTREKDTKYFIVGTVTQGKYKDGSIIIMDSPCMGMCSGNRAHLITRSEDIILLKKYSNVDFDLDKIYARKYAIDEDYLIQSLEFPKQINGPKKAQDLTLDEWWAEYYFDKKDLKKVFTNDQVGDVFTTSGFFSQPQNLFQKNGFYVKAADGTTRTYQFKPTFIKDYNLPEFIWEDGHLNDQQYNYFDSGGCGGLNYISVVSPENINRINDLKSIGKTKTDEVIYELKDSNHPYLKNFYENKYKTYHPNDQLSYEDFLKKHPLLFWIDPFDRLIKFESNELLPAAECGKPVIYLYPTKTTTVNVKLEPKGGFTKSEPAYDGGWLVKAEPNGALTNLKTGQTYPYLFWEGRGGIYETPKPGFVVEQKNVHAFLIETLALLGLNTQETADFMEFWEPKMQGKPYYFVTFAGNSMMNRLAPLTIDPKPDTIIRILMDFQGLDQPITVEPLTIQRPTRKGFTVVEWGGVLR